jgi:hypothetical protein
MARQQYDGRTFDVNLGGSIPEGLHLPASHLFAAIAAKATPYDLKQDATEKGLGASTDKRLKALEASVNPTPAPPAPTPIPIPTPTPVPPVVGTEYAFTQGPLDQGPEGECVGYGTAGYSATEPRPVTLVSAHTETEKATAELLYVAALVIDGTIQPGQAPDENAGASVSAGIQAALHAGLIVSSHAMASLADIVQALKTNPVLMGSEWLSGMMDPYVDGILHATGTNVGGHCWFLRGYNTAWPAPFLMQNSWGHWGPLAAPHVGSAFMTEADVSTLFASQGEAYVLTKA